MTESHLLENHEIVNLMMNEYSLYKGLGNHITNYERFTDDLIQDVFVILLEYDNEQLNSIWVNHKMRYVFHTICRRLKFNPTCKFNIQQRYEDTKHDIDISIVDRNLDHEYVSSEVLDKFSTEDTTLEEFNTSNEDYNLILATLDHNFDWYSVELFKMYYKLGDYNLIDGCKRDLLCKNETSSYRKMGKRTQIHYLSLQQSVKKTTDELKQILRKDTN